MRIKRLDIGLIMKTILEWTAEILSCNGKLVMGFKCKNDQIVSENFSGSSMGSVLEKTNVGGEAEDLCKLTVYSYLRQRYVSGLEVSEGQDICRLLANAVQVK